VFSFVIHRIDLYRAANENQRQCDMKKLGEYIRKTLFNFGSSL